MALPATGAPRPGIMVGSTSEFSLSSGQHTCLHFTSSRAPTHQLNQPSRICRKSHSAALNS